MPHDDSSSFDEACAKAMRLQVAGRLDLAEPIYRSILELQPAHGTANYCMGMLLVQARRPADALSHLLAAINAKPEIADYWLGYLEALLLLGERTEASNTLALARQHGLAGKAADEFASRLESQTPRGGAAAAPTASNATTIASNATTIAPNATAIAPNARRASRRREAQAIRRQEAAVLGMVKQGRFRDALPLAREMTERFPEYGAGWKMFAAMLWAAGTPEDAMTAMQTSVRLLPQDAEAHTNLGTALNKMRRIDEAEKRLLRALQIDPNFAPAHSQLADNYQLQGRYADAEASFRRAIASYAGDASSSIEETHTGFLFMLNHNPGTDANTLFTEHCRVGAHLERSAGQPASRHSNDPNPDRCLQVGFVSADLRNHAVANFIEPILRQWQNSGDLRVTVYFTHTAEDEVSRRLRGYVSRWFPVAAMSNAQLAQKIADDGIDILIDLSGYTSMHRLGAFARKPAPIQASWLGYPATTGLRAMDYYLTDKYFLPPGRFDGYFLEKLAYLPAVWTFEPFAFAPLVNPLPALESGCLTFGSFNRLGKINHATVRLWSQLLRALPEARMLVAGVPLDGQHHRVTDWFEAAGIHRDRLTFHPWSNMESLLALHHQVDIVLEPTPYTGCTSNNHALWMGLPTLTLAGPTPASRLAAANLGHLGLDEFIAESPDDFVARGLRWAGDLPALAALRSGLRARWLSAPARRPAFVAAGIELALRRMWRQWCAGLPPESFEITGLEAGSRQMWVLE